MALATSNGVGRPPNHNPDNALVDGPGLSPASPAAAVSRYGFGPSLLWAGNFANGFRSHGPWFVPDDVKADMDTDDTVAQCWTIVRGLALDKEPTVIRPYQLTTKTPTPQQQADYDKARMVGDFAAYCFRTADGGMYQWDYQLLDAMKRGCVVAVIVAKPDTYTEPATGKSGTKWTLDYLQILRRGEWVPYFDAGGHLVGFQVFNQWYEGLDANGKPQQFPVIWGKDKFVVATFRPESGLIWGNDLYSAAYLMYMLKNKGWEQYYAAIEQIGSPTAYHTTPEGLTANQKVPLSDASGNDLYWADETRNMATLTTSQTDFGRAMVSPQVAQHYTLQGGLRSLGLVGLAHGATLQYLQAQPSQAVPDFVESGTIGIHRAMVGTDKYAMRGTHESSGSSSAGERIASMPANEAKYMLESVRGQIVYSLTKWNYGANYLPYRPRVDFGSGLSGAIPALLNSLAAFATTNRATDGQIQGVLVNQCGFEQATAEEMAERPEPVAVASTGNANGGNDVPGSGAKAAS